MSELIERLSARFNDAALTPVEIPEWAEPGEETFTAYFEPWTLHDERSVKHFLDNENPDGWAAVVVKKLVDENRKPLFEKGDRVKLVRTCEAFVLKRVALEIMTSPVSVEDAAGN